MIWLADSLEKQPFPSVEQMPREITDSVGHAATITDRRTAADLRDKLAAKFPDYTWNVVDSNELPENKFLVEGK